MRIAFHILNTYFIRSKVKHVKPKKKKNTQQTLQPTVRDLGKVSIKRVRQVQVGKPYDRIPGEIHRVQLDMRKVMQRIDGRGER